MLKTDPTATVEEDLLSVAVEEGEEGLAEVEADYAGTVAPTDLTGNGAALAAALTAPPPIADEPSVLGELEAGELQALGVEPIPPIPIPILKLPTFGTYRSAAIAPFMVELRVDVDGIRATRRVSADYYSISGAVRTYFGSMRLDAATISVTSTLVTITGLASYTWAAGAPRVRITIPRVTLGLPPAPATLRHYTLGGSPGATYICRFAARSFRTLILEQDRQDSVASPFVSYNTGSLPSGGPARTLTVPGAYAEAGIGMATTGALGVVNTSEAGANARWSDAELHAAMVRHFSLWRDLPQWAVWLFHAFEHDIGPSLLGIMFDQIGKQRQGCAVFYRSIAGTTADMRRLQLFTCVHELGHCFNLLHSWQKSLAVPPQPNRPSSLSWMNYPWGFPAGQAVFWSTFPFRFDDLELVHLRHAFRDDVIMGGKPFGVGAGLEGAAWRDPEEDTSGLTLELSAPQSFPYGAPVSVDITLSASAAARRVSPYLRPRNGIVEIAVEKPGGVIVPYRPLLHHCASTEETVVIGPDHAPIQDSAFIGYGQDGFVFDDPGFYRVRARYNDADGSPVLSNTLTIRVRSPLSKEDDRVAELFFGDEQGTLVYLVGSDFEELQKGNDALAEVVSDHANHPLASYARIVLGANAAREFKTVYADNSVEVRPPKPKEAADLLGPVLDLTGMRRAGAKLEDDPVAASQAAAARLHETGPKAAVSDDVAAFVRARRREIAAEVMAS